MHSDVRMLSTAGLVGLGMVAAYVVLPSLLPGSGSTPQKRHTTGLVNTGNDCYANSTFQALAALTTLAEFLEGSSEDDTKPWTRAMGGALGEMRQEQSATPQQRSIWPLLRVMETLYHAHMSRGQQDAHELLVRVLELLEREQPDTPFSGTLTDEIRCLRCGHTTKKETPFLVLERFPGEDISRPQTETISDFRCSACGPAPSAIEKSSRISRWPRVLAVHINRSTYSSAAGFRNSQAVEIPAQLGGLHDLQLRAVVFHRGNHYRGHYTAARRKLAVGADDRRRPWWVISDDSVREGSTRQVLARQSEAYMLFYEAPQRGPPAPSVSQAAGALAARQERG